MVAWLLAKPASEHVQSKQAVAAAPCTVVHPVTPRETAGPPRLRSGQVALAYGAAGTGRGGHAGRDAPRGARQTVTVEPVKDCARPRMAALPPAARPWRQRGATGLPRALLSACLRLWTKKNF